MYLVHLKFLTQIAKSVIICNTIKIFKKIVNYIKVNLVRIMD